MKRLMLYGSMVLLALAVSCTKDETIDPQIFLPDEGETVVLNFSHENFDDLEVRTRGLAEAQTEWRVENMFVCIYETEGSLKGKRVYAHTFDAGELKSTKEEVFSRPNEVDECWWVKNMSAQGEVTEGVLKIKMPSLSKANVYMVANVHLLDLSPELLDIHTSSEENLKNMFVTASATTLFRTGFVMTGKVEAVKRVATEGVQGEIRYAGTTPGTPRIELQRIDARVKVNMRIQSQAEREAYDKAHPDIAAEKRPYLKAFYPVKWEVVNMPRNMRLVGDDISLKTDPQEAEKYKYFNVTPTNFETVEPTGHKNLFGENITTQGFGFYLLENIQPDATANITSFHERERRKKTADTGEYEGFEGQGRNDIWVYAPKDATYMKISGQLEMIQRQNDGKGASASRQLFADVTYYIHLGSGVAYQMVGGKLEPVGGDAARLASLKNFSVERNTSYTYNITILGVNSILVEVQSSKKIRDEKLKPSDLEERQPSATGDSFEALEAYYKFDSHFSQRVYRFRVENMIPDSETGLINLTWYVETPFSVGSPHLVGSSAGSLDYKWVHFLRNNMKGDPLDEQAQFYSQRNRYYPGDDYAQRTDIPLKDRMMDVNVFTEYLIRQAQIYWNNIKYPDGQQIETDFRRERDKEGKLVFVPGKENLPETDESKYYHVIYFTAFVDEFYYDKHPISGAPVSWREFVNGRDRMMHLLCDRNMSLDGASSVTQSVSTIRQSPIQTIYNADLPEQINAWGVEMVDEPVITRDKAKDVTINGEMIRVPGVEYYPATFFNEDDINNSGWVNQSVHTNDYDGMINTRKLLKANNRSTKWTDYLKVYNADNEIDPIGGDPLKWELAYNDEGFLKQGKRSLLNGVLLRNRDHNGDGVIQDLEIKWYAASDAQLAIFYMGDTGVAGDAKFYPASKVNDIAAGNWEAPPKWTKVSTNSFKDTSKWRSHIVSSTVTSATNGPEVLWAEEGLSMSRYFKFDWGAKERGAYQIRCLRNLKEKPAAELDKIVRTIEEKVGSGTSAINYKFDLRNLNKESLRHRGEKVDPDLVILPPSDEHAESSFLPLGLETGEFISIQDICDIYNKNSTDKVYPPTGEKGFRDFYRNVVKRLLERGIPICPEGYRVPNLREAGLMCFYCSSDWWARGDRNTFVSTYWSMEEITGTGKPSWNVGRNNDAKFFTQALAGSDAKPIKGVRCVRDWDPR